MGKGKGPGGMTTIDAVCQGISRLKKATGDEISKEVKKIHEWKDDNILQCLMAQTVNLQPGYRRWPDVKQKYKCLFLGSDGYFEYYDRNKHGIFEDGIRVQ